MKRAPARILPLVSLLSFPLVFPSPAPAETVPQVVARDAAPLLSPQAESVEGATVTTGHITLNLTHGTLVPVMAGKERIGFFFAGQGSWTYLSECPDEFAVLRRNISAATGWKHAESPGKITITDTFDNVLWVAPGAALPPGTPATAASSLAGTFRKHQDSFARYREDSLAQRVAYLEMEAPEAPFAWGEFSGGKNEDLYLLDGVEERSESLSVLTKSDFDSANAPWEWFALPVSQQPIGRAFRENPPYPVVLTDVEPRIEADGEHAKISVAETFLVNERRADALRLDLQSRVFAGTSVDQRPENLLKVTAADGSEIPFDHSNDHLLLKLLNPVLQGSSITLHFDLEGNILWRPEGDNYWLLGIEPWFPQPPQFGAAHFTWACRLKVKKPFVPILNGMPAGHSQEGDWNIASSKFDRPIFYPVVMAGKYSVDEETIDGRHFRVASYAYHNARASKHLSTLASQIIKYYETFLGPFPWPEFTIIEMDSYGYGVAPPATMFITREAFSPHEDELTKFFSQGLNERFGHEIAHQYWGNQVGWRGGQEEWLSESFAEYSAALLIRQMKGKSAYKSLVGTWLGMANDTKDHATIPTANGILGERGFFDRTNLLYGKGPYLLYALNQELGDNTFLTAMKTYQTNLAWRSGSTALFENLLEFLTKKSWSDFFDKYYWGTAIPKVKD